MVRDKDDNGCWKIEDREYYYEKLWRVGSNKPVGVIKIKK